MALDGAGFNIVIRAVATLLPHEQTIPEHVDKMVREIEREGVQKDPVVIDEDSGTVLDGMHRVAAFSRLGLENAVCCSVDYSSAAVAVSRWARVYTSIDRGALMEAVGAAGITRAAPLSHALGELDARRAGLAAMISQKVFLPARQTSLAEAFSIVEGLDSASQKNGWRRDFVPEDEVVDQLKGAEKLVVMVQKLVKDDVLRAAGTRRLFPCKTSMHTIDPRPVGLSFPTSQLRGATTESLRGRVAASEGRLLPANSVYEGRRYKERLLVLGQA